MYVCYKLNELFVCFRHYPIILCMVHNYFRMFYGHFAISIISFAMKIAALILSGLYIVAGVFYVKFRNKVNIFSRFSPTIYTDSGIIYERPWFIFIYCMYHHFIYLHRNRLPFIFNRLLLPTLLLVHISKVDNICIDLVLRLLFCSTGICVFIPIKYEFLIYVE